MGLPRKTAGSVNALGNGEDSPVTSARFPVCMEPQILCATSVSVQEAGVAVYAPSVGLNAPRGMYMTVHALAACQRVH